MDKFLEMKRICKYFEGVRANYNVDFSVNRGEVHALLGENGAGKTTLMNILYGLYTATSGEIYLNGQKAEISSPLSAIKLGIGMVHQHFMLIPELTVIENVVLGLKGEKSPRLDLKTSARKLRQLAEQYHMEIDPFAKVWQLSVGQQQRVEILKALYRGAELLILDEPTAVLTPQEVDALFQMIDALKGQDKTVIFISHKLKEVIKICDRMTVLRLGEVVATVENGKTSEHALAAMMVGRAICTPANKRTQSPMDARAVLKLKDVACFNAKGVKALKGVNLQVCAGEILGICGVDGNGQSELVECITGLRKVVAGEIIINGSVVTNAKPSEILRKNVAHIPEDRLKSGIVIGMDLVENILLMNYDRDGFAKGELLDWVRINSYSEELLETYNVKTPGPHEMIENLSGGNQQKLVLGRELLRKPELLIAMHPVRGLDIGATEYIHDALLKERERGAAILLVSTELDELIALSDRVAVIYEGEIMGIVPPDIDISQLGLMMAGEKYSIVR